MAKLLPRDCLNILTSEFDLNSQAKIARFLGVTQPRVSQINGSNNLTKTHIKALLKGAFRAGRQEAYGDANTTLLDAFGKMRTLDTQLKLASALKKTQGAVAQWKSGYSRISPQTTESILKKSAHLMIRGLVELEEVDPGRPGASHWYFYSGRTNVKRARVLKKLERKRGIYVYFDATGRPTYVGKADKTTLDREVEGRLSQRTKEGRIPYGKGMTKNPRLRQGEIARYISAYEISPTEAIPLIEALLIRATGNILFNKRLENLSE
jgi:transcriptional regulator with XRE-family HTH domain